MTEIDDGSATDSNDASEDDELVIAVRDAIPVVGRFLEQDESAYAHIDALFRNHLEGGVDVDTQGVILEGLTFYAGPEVAQGLFTLLARASRDPDLFASEICNLQPETESALRALGGIYGSALQKAHDYAWEDPEDWLRVTRDPVWVPANEAWRFNITIYKYSGEQLRLGLRAGAMMTLAEALLNTLLLPEEHVDPIEDWRVAGLMGVYEQIVERYGDSVAAGDAPAAEPIADA